MLSRIKTHFRPLLLVLLSNGITIIFGNTSFKSLVNVPTLEEKQARIGFVGKALCDRLAYVKAGKRTPDFAAWVQERGGEANVLSMHGVDVNFEMDELQNLDLQVEIVPVSKKKTKIDPFLPDRLNLKFADDSKVKFNPSNAKENDDKPATALQLSLRAAKLTMHFAPVTTTAWLAVLSSKFRKKIWYRWVSACLASGGAAFIKWGQWAATRTDMFPVELCDALSELHSSAPAHSWNYTQDQVEASLDIPSGSLFEVFESFDAEPLASGSIAQVHKARLRNGELIAAKVRHPRVARLIDMDFRLMTMLASVFDWIPALKWLHIKDSVSQFSHTMAAQAHLNVEAHHLEVLNHNFRAWDRVGFPKPIYASSSVILETYERGSIVTELLDHFDSEAESMENETQGYQIIPVDLAKFLVTSGVSLYLKMLLLDNLMHADLHPGNIMVDVPKTEEDKKPKIGGQKYGITLVDAGMVAQLTDEESSTFVGLFTALGSGNGKAAAEFALRFSIDNDMDDEGRVAFVRGMCDLFAEKCQGYGTDVDVGEVLRGVLGLIKAHRVRIDANFATLVINAMCVESIARRLCPTYNVLDAARPLLETYRKLCYEKDGCTPRNKDGFHKRVKKMMPIMLYSRKKKFDDAFFNNVERQRRRQG